jgi:predicted dehydrogenase
MDKIVRIAIVGTGVISKAYAEALRDLNEVRLVAACDVHSAAAAAFAASANCAPYSQFDAMVANEKIDAVVICTPPATHEELALAAMQRGLHVLCEKPLSVDIASARRMVKAALAHHVILTMASKFRFVEDVRRARELIARGTIGDLVLIENAFTSHVDMSQRWNSNPSMSGGGVLIDNGTHSVDILRFFMGELCDVQIFEGRRVQNVAVEDTVRLFVRNASGTIGTADLSWSINKELDTFLRIYGSEGTILVGWKRSLYKRSDSDQWVEFGSGYNKVTAFRNQIANFAAAVRGQAAIELTTADALASVEVIAAGYSALSGSRWQQVRVRIGEIPAEAESPAALEVVV